MKRGLKIILILFLIFALPLAGYKFLKKNNYIQADKVIEFEKSELMQIKLHLYSKGKSKLIGDLIYDEDLIIAEIYLDDNMTIKALTKKWSDAEFKVLEYDISKLIK